MHTGYHPHLIPALQGQRPVVGGHHEGHNVQRQDQAAQLQTARGLLEANTHTHNEERNQHTPNPNPTGRKTTAVRRLTPIIHRASRIVPNPITIFRVSIDRDDTPVIIKGEREELRETEGPQSHRQRGGAQTPGRAAPVGQADGVTHPNGFGLHQIGEGPLGGRDQRPVQHPPVCV